MKIHNNPNTISPAVRYAIADLLIQLGQWEEFTLDPLQGGANNQCYRLDGAHDPLFVKIYFQHPEDTRNRLFAEYSFAGFIWDQGIYSIPQPIACDTDVHCALYSYIEGRTLSVQDVTSTAIDKALRFFIQINEHRHCPKAVSLPAASEACFSIAEHLACMTRRIQRLVQIPVFSDTDRAAESFIRTELQDAWRTVSSDVHDHASCHRLDVDEALAPCDRCLSPSDFGFHNTLMTADGRLWFHDFEYAGWDDPAKLVCDFFCQPKVPVPRAYFDMFSSTVSASFSEPEKHRMRFYLLLPVYQIKWCCILLNEFLPSSGMRRRFAGYVENEEERKASQLRKARWMLEQMVHAYEM